MRTIQRRMFTVLAISSGAAVKENSTVEILEKGIFDFLAQKAIVLLELLFPLSLELLMEVKKSR